MPKQSKPKYAHILPTKTWSQFRAQSDLDDYIWLDYLT